MLCWGSCTISLVHSPMQDFQLTDFERDITDDAAVGQLCDGCCLHAICASGQTHLLAPARVSECAFQHSVIGSVKRYRFMMQPWPAMTETCNDCHLLTC